MGFLAKLLGLGKNNFESVVKNAPNQVGVYVVKQDSKVVYVGRAIENRSEQATCGLRKRLQEHWRGASTGNKKLYQSRDSVNITINPCNNSENAKKMEATLIRKYNTVTNGWNKRYED